MQLLVCIRHKGWTETAFHLVFFEIYSAKRTQRLVHIVPCALAAQNIFDFLLLHVLSLKVALVDDEMVGAGETLEAVLANIFLGSRIAGWYFGDAQHVAARWTDYGSRVRLANYTCIRIGSGCLTEQHGADVLVLTCELD
jgi:hypothetical protein